MGVRGTKSSAEIVSLKVNGMPPRLTAPSGLNAEERRMFTELVGDCHPRHFVKSDLPLLISFVQSTLLSRHAAKSVKRDPNMLATWHTATRMQATLATRNFG